MKPFAVALASAFALSTSSLAAEAPDAAILDARISEGLDKLGVVGLGVAVWTPKGTYARGFGVTNVESGEKVSAETAFYIASSTKSFTALAMKTPSHVIISSILGPSRKTSFYNWAVNMRAHEIANASLQFKSQS